MSFSQRGFGFNGRSSSAGAPGQTEIDSDETTEEEDEEMDLVPAAAAAAPAFTFNTDEALVRRLTEAGPLMDQVGRELSPETRPHLYGRREINGQMRREAEVRDAQDRAALAQRNRAEGTEYTSLLRPTAAAARPVGRFQAPHFRSLPRTEAHVYSAGGGMPSYPQEAAAMRAMAARMGISESEAMQMLLQVNQGEIPAGLSEVEIDSLHQLNNLLFTAEASREPGMAAASGAAVSAAAHSPEATARELLGERRGRRNSRGLIPATSTGATASFRAAQTGLLDGDISEPHLREAFRAGSRSNRAPAAARVRDARERALAMQATSASLGEMAAAHAAAAAPQASGAAPAGGDEYYGAAPSSEELVTMRRLRLEAAHRRAYNTPAGLLRPLRPMLAQVEEADDEGSESEDDL